MAFVDDHEIVLEGLMAYLQRTMPEFVLAGTAKTPAHLFANGTTADICVLDVDLCDDSAPQDNVQALVSAGISVLLYTQVTANAVIQRCVRAGACGIVGKGEEKSMLVEAIRTVGAGEAWFSADWAQALRSDKAWLPQLSAREAEVLRMYATGLPMKSVAHSLGVTTETIKSHLGRVRTKYADAGRDARTRSELLVRAVEDGLLPPPGLNPTPPRA